MRAHYNSVKCELNYKYIFPEESIMKNEAMERAKESFRIESKAISDILEYLDYDAFGKAVDALKSCQRIAASGCGHSGIACRHFAHSMCCIERPARFISPSEAVHGAMGFVQKGDVVVLASRGGKTSELLPIMRISKTKGAIVIAITENMDSPLAKESDIVIHMKVDRECDKYNSQGTASFVALSAIFDALQVALIEETGYVNEQFALIHPGGAVGERLNN
jgi:D-arabinose 5-phosphate isomerase GutQ